MIKLMRCALMVSVFLLTASLFGGYIGTRPAFAKEAVNKTVLADYRQIPGITPEETAAIELLRSSRASFIFGMNQGSTECFIRPDGSIGGSAVLLSQWLSEVFGITFELKAVDWNTLIHGLESFEIDFTAELTPTESRRSSYYMTIPIANRMIIYLKNANSGDISNLPTGRLPRYGFLEGGTTLEMVAPFLPKNF
ncbi:MAG: transporter substrate-binding domain-containing protein, partial [Deltaproteobacteria bacterium]|nr:transporter substrate-binding domain-containing protein [Deltaproteobacteria bacterium]